MLSEDQIEAVHVDIEWEILEGSGENVERVLSGVYWPEGYLGRCGFDECHCLEGVVDMNREEVSHREGRIDYEIKRVLS